MTDWYTRAIRLNNEINLLIEKRSRIYAAALRVTPTYSDMPKCQCSTDAIQDTIDRICEIDEKINQRIDRLHTVKKEIIDAIRTVENTTDRLCMVKRFIEMKSWRDISNELNIPRRSVAYYVARGINNTRYCTTS